MKLSLAALLAAATLLSASAADRPNVMVFLVDDMGVMDTSVPFLTDEKGAPKRYPLNDFYRTPGMERLAKQGIRFNQFYAMSVCSPTRISIMTGPKRRSPSCDKLDQPMDGQRWRSRAQSLELDGIGDR